MKIANIDFDSIIYAASCKETIFEGIQYLKDKMEYIMSSTNATHYFCFITQGKCFRYDIYPDYKANRKDREKPKWLNTLYEYSKVEYKAVSHPKLEADDLISLFNSDIVILCSIDSDIKTIPGNHFNYNTGEFREVTIGEAQDNLSINILAGKAKDNVPGLKGCGKVTAKNYVDWCNKNYTLENGLNPNLLAYTKGISKDKCGRNIYPLGYDDYILAYKLNKIISWYDIDSVLTEEELNILEKIEPVMSPYNTINNIEENEKIQW